jgi:hypothetical protein
MDRRKTMAIPQVGHAREEYYTPTKREEFGLNKRTRRAKQGETNLTTPDGKKYVVSGKPTGN